ncbi:MAG: alanine--tRNA ligase, partial [Methanothrix sp.]
LQVVAQKMENADVDALIKAASMLSEKDYVAILGSGEKIVATVGATGLARGLKAGDIIKTAANVLGGGGGGKPQIAQGGGPNAEKLDEALEAGLEAIRSTF